MLPRVNENLSEIDDAQNPADEPERRPLPRREKRAATRERLLKATIALLRSEGIGALTTVAITKAAGLAQSGFYLHFAGVDDAKRAAAELVAERIRAYVARQRRRVHTLDPNDLKLLQRYCQKMLEIFETEPRFAEIFLHNRHDRSPLGAVMRELRRQLRDDLVEDLQNVLFRQRKIEPTEREIVSLQAEIILAAALACGEAIIEKRVQSIESAAELLAVNVLAATDARVFSK